MSHCRQYYRTSTFDKFWSTPAMKWQRLVPASTCGNFKNGIPRTNCAIAHRLLRPSRWWLVVKIEPIPTTTVHPCLSPLKPSSSPPSSSTASSPASCPSWSRPTASRPSSSPRPPSSLRALPLRLCSGPRCSHRLLLPRRSRPSLAGWCRPPRPDECHPSASWRQKYTLALHPDTAAITAY